MASRPSRAQTTIATGKKTEFFSDFMTSFAKTPVGDQLAKVTNERSINQSLKNIILTDVGERLFQPNFGSNIRALLFESSVESNLSTIEFYIRTSIENNEKRINLIGVSVEPSENESEIAINVVYNTINNPEPILFTYILKRVR